jgi:hypothetical protein
MTKAEVEFWSKRLAEESFLSEKEARRRVFALREADVRINWNTPDDAITHIESRFFADTMPLYRCGVIWKVGKPLSETSSFPIPATVENVEKARAFLIKKWKERSKEMLRPAPEDLTGACKFASLFAQKVFGGEIRGNWHHQFVVLAGGEKLDLTAGLTRDRIDYRHDPEFWNNPEHIRSMQSCLPRVEAWANEFVKSNLNEYLTMTSDFSDGTNGEPTAYPPSGGGAGSAVGLPDYKYTDRIKKRREKLAALKQRRDPDGILGDRVLGESVNWIGPVYHASPERFSTFDTSREGAHFGTFEQAANLQKPGLRAPQAYYISLQNPLRLPDIGVWNNFNNLHAVLSVEGHITDEQADSAWAAWQRSDDEGWEALKQALHQNGYDGIVYENEQEGAGDSYLVFWSHQIKPTR